MLFRVGFEKDVWLLLSCFRRWLMVTAAAAANSSSTSSSSRSSGHQQQHQQQQQSKFDSIGILVGFPKGRSGPPGRVLLRLILHHCRHEISWCFAVSSGFRKRCLAVAFLLSTLADGSSSSSPKIGQHSPKIGRRPSKYPAFYNVFCCSHFSDPLAQHGSTWANIGLKIAKPT